MNAITEFRGPTRWLSNFEYVLVTIDGKTYATNEHYYQACKATAWSDLDHEAIRRLPTPREAKNRGQTIPLRPDWEEVKDDVMLKGLRAKFAPGSDLAAKLLATGDAVLIEGNTHGDRYWGTVWDGTEWVGKNVLGKLLMQVRDELRT